MSTPVYHQVPPSEFYSAQPSFPPPPPQSDNKIIGTAVEERGYSPDGLEKAMTPATGLRGLSHRIRAVSQKFWLFELAASFVSLLFFGGIIIVLVIFDNSIYLDDSKEEDPNEKGTIFPILAILGAVMRAAMLLPVATAIAQLKWGWFRTSRRLADIERFDSAASGVLGSLKLLWTLKFRNVAVVGAALTILALPLDAVIQSSVKILPTTIINDQPTELVDPIYVDKNFTMMNVTDKTLLARTRGFDSFQEVDYTQMYNQYQPYLPQDDMVNSIKFGLQFDNGLDKIFKPVVNHPCPTGYCTFNTYQTLAVGYQCLDRTSEIITTSAKDGVPAYQQLPGAGNVLYYNGGQRGNTTYDRQLINAASYFDWPDQTYTSGSFDDSGPLIIRTVMLINNEKDDKSATTLSSEERAAKTVAAECVLFWYIKTSEDHVSRNTQFSLKSEPKAINTTYRRAAAKSSLEWIIEPEQCIVEGKQVPKDNSTFYSDNCLFTVGKKGQAGLQNFFGDYTEDTTTGNGFKGDAWLKNKEYSVYTRMTDYVANLRGVIRSSPHVLRRVDTMWGKIAFSMSTTVRARPSYQSETDSYEFLYTSGTVYRAILYYHIDWPRIGAPAFVVGFSAFFVLFTAIATRKQHRWKRSVLPLLFHGLGERERAAMSEKLTSLSTMQEISEQLTVKLESKDGANRARFVYAP